MRPGKSGRKMKFIETPLAGAYVIELEKREDDRGYFARTFCEKEFSDYSLQTKFIQSNTAFNKQVGITRGLHFQHSPHAEVKLVRCTRGRIFDVLVDVREGSATRYQWFGVELSEQNASQLYVPEGFAHGYQVLEAHTEISYLVSASYAPESEDGLRWDDPRLAIEWPMKNGLLLSDKDKAWPLIVAP